MNEDDELISGEVVATKLREVAEALDEDPDELDTLEGWQRSVGKQLARTLE